MGQENAEKQINFDDLKKIVSDAIKSKDTFAIETINDEKHLRYIQKYIELQISNSDSKISFLSLDTGIKGISLGIIAVGISLFLVGVSINNISKISYSISGIMVTCLGIWLDVRTNKYKRQFKNIEKDIEFMHTLILKIEEKLINHS